MQQFFICKQTEVDLKLTALTKTGTSDDGWTQYYLDKSTNDNWLLTVYHSEYHGGGVQVLKRLPVPTIDQLIDIALTSLNTNDIIGASLELSEREKYKKEDFRKKLLDRLSQVDLSNLSEFEKKRLEIIIYESDLYDATNRRDIIGNILLKYKTTLITIERLHKRLRIYLPKLKVRVCYPLSFVFLRINPKMD